MIGLLRLGIIMIVYVNSTNNLGDFLNAMPVLSSINKVFGKYDLIVGHGLKKFKGFSEFLMYQDLFNSIKYEDEVFLYGNVMFVRAWADNWCRENCDNPNRPTETAAYGNWLEDFYGMKIPIDDTFEIKVPELNIEVEDVYYCGDRWNVPGIDDRRKSEVLSHLEGMKFLNYDNDLLTNAYIIKNLKKPFITNFTGVAVLADLLNVESYVVWKPEDWNPEFVKDDNIEWAGGKDINSIFKKHFYQDRKSKLIHAKILPRLL